MSEFVKHILVITALLLCISPSAQGERGPDSQTSEVSAGPASLAPIEVRDEPIRESDRILGSQRVWLRSSKSTSVTQQLSELPSVLLRKWGTDESAQVLSLRGQDPHQTRLYLNGFPMGEVSGGSSDTRWVRPRWLSHADVLPNGNPMRLWRESLGGAIDLQTDFSEEGVSDPFEVNALAGSFGARGVGGRLLQGDYAVQFDLRTADDDFAFRDSAGTLWDLTDDAWARRNHNQWWRASVLPWAKWKLAGSDQSVFWLGGWEGRQLPGAAGAIDYQNWSEQLQLVGFNAEGAGSRWQLRSFARYRHSRLDNPQSQRSGSFAGIPGESQDVAGGISLGSRTELSSHWNLQGRLGLDQQNLRNKVYLGNTADIQGQKRSASAALSSQWAKPIRQQLILPLEWTELSPFTGVVGYPGQPRRQFLLFSPRWNVSWELASQAVAHTQLAWIANAPGLYDLYGDARGLAPNPSLVPESAVKAEVGIHWTTQWGTSRITVLASSSWSENQDLLVRVSNGPTSAVVQNIGRSRVLAQELAAKATFSGGWVVNASAQYLFSRNLSDVVYHQGRELPFRPPWRIQGDLEKHWGRFSLGYLWQWQSRFFADQPNFKKVNSFQEHSLRARYQGEEVGDWLLELNNIFDVTVVEAVELGRATRITPSGLVGFPYPGRRVYLSWNYSW